MCHVVKTSLVQCSFSTKQRRKTWNFRDQQYYSNTAVERKVNDDTKQCEKSKYILKHCAKMAKLKAYSMFTHNSSVELIDKATFVSLLYKQLATLCKHVMMVFTTILCGIETLIQSCSSFLNGQGELAHTLWPWLLVLLVVNLAKILPTLATENSLLNLLDKQFSRTLFIEVQRYITYTNGSGYCNITMSPETVMPCVDSSQVFCCIGENQMNIVNAVLRSESKRQSKQKMDRMNLHSKEPTSFTNKSLLPSSSQPSAMYNYYKHTPPNLESAAYTTQPPKPHDLNQQQIENNPGDTVHSTSILPAAPPLHKMNCGRETTPSNKETRKHVGATAKEIEHFDQSMSTNPAKKA